MSVARRCDFFKATDSKWYCMLGDREYAYDDDDCTAYGPFSSERAATEYIRDNFSNPGSSWTEDDSKTEPPKGAVRPTGPSVTHTHWRL